MRFASLATFEPGSAAWVLCNGRLRSIFRTRGLSRAEIVMCMACLSCATKLTHHAYAIGSKYLLAPMVHL